MKNKFLKCPICKKLPQEIDVVLGQKGGILACCFAIAYSTDRVEGIAHINEWNRLVIEYRKMVALENIEAYLSPEYKNLRT